MSVQLHCWFQDKNFGINIYHLPYFWYTGSEGSGETVRMRRLVLAIAARLCNTIESRQFGVLGTRDVISKYRKFELWGGGRHKNISPPHKKGDYYQFFYSIKHMFCVRKRNVSGRRFFYEHKTYVAI